MTCQRLRAAEAWRVGPRPDGSAGIRGDMLIVIGRDDPRYADREQYAGE